MPRKDPKAWRAANKDIWYSYYKKWQQRNKPKLASDKRKWREENREHFVAWRKANTAKNKESLRKYRREYYLKNKARLTAFARCANQKRKKYVRIATPSWANHFFISEAYQLAALRTALTGIKWHVDHIVPLRSKRVCGLHVEKNLQVIPGIQNQEKNNSYWPDMP